MKDLHGKVAVVTGGAGGIGRALVERFSNEGMRVVLADILPDVVDRTTGELRDQGMDVTGVVTDVSSLESVEALRDATLEAYGAVHVVCNNAGIGSGSQGEMWTHHVQDWRWSVDVNVFGVINGINAFVPTMIEQGDEGHIVNTTSGNGGFTPIVGSAIYATTKAAVTTITECLWGQLREAGSKVSASLLYPSSRTPGFLNTGLWRAGANRPERYDRPGAPPKEGRDGLSAVKEKMEAAGLEVTFAPLEEVADLCVEGIRNDVFWMTYPSESQAALIQARATSQIERSTPEYLIQGSVGAALASRRTNDDQES